MADRGQITGGILDGPLAVDNALSEVAAKMKGIISPVAGRADIFVVPDLESGNMIAKLLEYLAEAEVAGIVMGAGANCTDEPSRQTIEPYGFLCDSRSLWHVGKVRSPFRPEDSRWFQRFS